MAHDAAGVERGRVKRTYVRGAGALAALTLPRPAAGSPPFYTTPLLYLLLII